MGRVSRCWVCAAPRGGYAGRMAVVVRAHSGSSPPPSLTQTYLSVVASPDPGGIPGRASVGASSQGLQSSAEGARLERSAVHAPPCLQRNPPPTPARPLNTDLELR